MNVKYLGEARVPFQEQLDNGVVVALRRDMEGRHSFDFVWSRTVFKRGTVIK